MMAVHESVLDIRDLSKSYGATVALQHVSIALKRGEVHAVLGENGAGKSTFVKVLSGVVQPDSGSMLLGGRPYAPVGVMAARHRGVATAFQELSLLPNLSVAQNLFLPAPAMGRGLINQRRLIQQAAAILKRFGVDDIDPRQEVGTLNLADKQRLEIMKAFASGTEIIVLDEPTAALVDTSWLFELIRRATKEGTTFLYISHRLGEIRVLCDRGTVLRNGSSVGTVCIPDVSDADVFRLMVGRSSDGATAWQRPQRASVEKRLHVQDLSCGPVKGIDLSVGAGEIVGLAGLDGQGQVHLLKAIAGLEHFRARVFEVSGKPVSITSPRHALQIGIAYVPEERKVDGIFRSLPTNVNISLPSLRRAARIGMIRRSAEKALVDPAAASVELNPRYLNFRICNLSGGNQQKAVLARAFATGAKLVVLFDPTRGVDVGTKETVYRAMREFVSKGGGILFYSSELPEIAALCCRCHVIYGGRIAATLEGSAISEERLVAAATGHSSSSTAVRRGHE